ncbi:hypothetical protein D3C78_1147120 [compost metagenome]
MIRSLVEHVLEVDRPCIPQLLLPGVANLLEQLQEHRVAVLERAAALPLQALLQIGRTQTVALGMGQEGAEGTH